MKGKLVHKTPACAVLGEGSNHKESIVPALPYILQEDDSTTRTRDH